MTNKLHLTKACRRLLLFVFLVSSGLVPNAHLYSQTQLSGAQTRITTNVQTGVSYTVQVSDCGKLISLSNASPIAVTIPQAGTAGLSAGCWMDIQNTGSGVATLTATGTLIDRVPSIVLTTNQGLRLISDGTAYYTQRGQGSAWNGALSVQSEGSLIGSSSTINVVPGTGVACIPQVSSGVMTLQCNADTSYLASKPSLQGSTNPQICTSASGSGTTYTAACATSLDAYAAKQTLSWYSDVTNTTTAPTINIDTLGAKPLVRQDGTALANGDIKATALYRIWYDGANFRVAEAGARTGTGGIGSVTSTHLAGTDSGQNVVAANSHDASATLDCIASSASGTAYACSTVPSFPPAAGDSVWFKADVANIASATLSVNSATPATIKKQQGAANLAVSDLQSGGWTQMTFDGTNWQMQGQLGNSPGGGVGITYLYNSGPLPAISTTPSATTGGGSPPDATDTLIWDTGPLPALAAGKCMNWSLVLAVSNSAGGDTIGIWYGAGARTGNVMFLYASTEPLIELHGVICNDAGTQTAQTGFITGGGSNAHSYPQVPAGNMFVTMSQNTVLSTLHLSVTNATNSGSGVTTNTLPISFQVW